MELKWIQGDPDGAKMVPAGGQNRVKGQPDRLNWTKIYLGPKIRRPLVGRVRATRAKGGGLPPPTPSALGTSPPNPRTNTSIRTLYVNWCLNFAQIQKSCGAKLFHWILHSFSLNLNLSETVKQRSARFGLNEAWERLLHVWRLVLYVQEVLCTFRRLSARAGGLLHGKAFSLGRAEGSLHGEACSHGRTENPLHVCTSLGVPISIHILDPWPSNRPFWQLGQLDAEMTQNGSQIVHFGYLGYLGSLVQKCSKFIGLSHSFGNASHKATPIRNNLGITKGAHGPLPPRAPKAPKTLPHFAETCLGTNASTRLA